MGQVAPAMPESDCQHEHRVAPVVPSHIVQATGVLSACRLDKLDKHKRQMGFVPQNDIMYR